MSSTDKKRSKAKASNKSKLDSKDENKVINLQRIYVRDLSFEVPNAPEVFAKQWEPKVDVHINTKWRKVEDNIYEVVIKIEVTAKNDGKIAFITEVEQAGSFLITNLSKEELARALISTCPNTLFPYVRETLDNLLIKGSLPPMHLAQINFHVLYEEKLRRQKGRKQKDDKLDNWDDFEDEAESKPIDKSKIN